MAENKMADWIARHFLPDSYVRLAWDGFIFLVIWYNSVITPIRIFIMYGDKTPQVLISLDVIGDHWSLALAQRTLVSIEESSQVKDRFMRFERDIGLTFS